MIGTLLSFRLRRDWLQLVIWIAVTGFLAYFSATQVAATFDSTTNREVIAHFAATNPTLLIVRGIPQGTSIDSLVFFQVFTYLAILAALMSGFLTVRHSRAEEELGRADLVASTPAGRTRPTIATIFHGLIANFVMGTVVAVTLIVAGLQAEGSVLTGIAVAATGVSFVAIGLFASQLMRSSRGANSVILAVLAVSFLLRATGDATGTVSADGVSVSSSWPSWLSVIGWGQQTHAYTDNNAWSLLFDAVLFVIVLAAVFVLQNMRDMGASFISQRKGRRTAPAFLSGSWGLGWRLQWPTILSWCVTSAIFGLFAPTLAPTISHAIGNDSTVQRIAQNLVPGVSGSIEQLFISVIFGIVGVLAAICATQVVIRMRQEETLGTAEILLTTSITRRRWFATYVSIGFLAIVCVLSSAVIAAMVGFISISTSGADTSGIGFDDVFFATLAQAPAALVYLAVVSFIFIILPRFTIPLGWGVIGAGAFLTFYGDLIGVPEWIRDLSPFTHSPVGASPDWSGGWVMIIGACAVAVLGLWLIRFREIGSSTQIQVGRPSQTTPSPTR